VGTTDGSVRWGEVVLYDRGPDSSFDHTRDGRHHLWIDEHRQGGITLVWDGEPGQPFEDEDGGEIGWSEDGNHAWAYVQTPQGVRVWADGRLGPPFEGVSRSVEVRFSPDGTRLAYGAIVKGNPQLVVDHVVQPGVPLAPVPPLWSPDSSRLAWVEHERANDPQAPQRMVIDGRPGRWTAGISIRPQGRQFSPDSRRIAWFERESPRSGRFVVDGELGPPIGDASEAWWTPDSAHFVYLAQTDRGWSLMGGPAPGPVYRGAHDLRVEDSVIAYAAVSDDKTMHAVTNGISGPRFERIGSLTVLPDGRLAYPAVRSGSGLLGPFRKEAWMTVDGAAIDREMFDDLLVNISVNAGRLFYVGIRNKSHHAVVDGRVGPPVRAIRNGLVTATGRVFYLADTTAGTVALVHKDRIVREARGHAVPDPLRDLFPTADEEHVGWIAQLEDGRWHPMLDDQAGPGYDMVTAPWLGDDGMLVFSASRDGTVFQVRAS
jgi:hypothetical protein